MSIIKELIMRTITRDHLFSNRFNFVKLCKKYAYMATEKQIGYTKVLITETLKKAFDIEDWDVLEQIFTNNY